MIVAVGALITVVLTVVSLLALRSPLLALLTELCVLEHRASFWWRVVGVQMIAGTTVCVSLAARGDTGPGAWQLAAGLIRGASAGLLLSLVAIIIGVLMFERQVARHTSRTD